MFDPIEEMVNYLTEGKLNENNDDDDCIDFVEATQTWSQHRDVAHLMCEGR